MFPQKRSHRAGGSPKGNEHHRKAKHECQRRSEKPGPWLLPLAQLLHADAGKHRDVARNQWKNARREKRNQSCEKGRCQRDVGHAKSVLTSLHAKGGGKCTSVFDVAQIACIFLAIFWGSTSYKRGPLKPSR